LIVKEWGEKGEQERKGRRAGEVTKADWFRGGEMPASGHERLAIENDPKLRERCLSDVMQGGRVRMWQGPRVRGRYC